MSASADLASQPLPALRQDLRLLAGPTDFDGASTRTLYDPLRGRYFRIGWQEFWMLACWSAGTIGALIEKVTQESTCRIGPEDVVAFLRFLQDNDLLLSPPSGRVEEYVAKYSASRLAWWQWLIHHYLFFRIPLFRPERFLRATLPYLQPMFSPRAHYGLAVLGGLALYMVSRQWDAFLAYFPSFFNWEGLLAYAVAIVFAKLVHELGHGYAAVRYGCHVPTMGVAFLVLLPMLYTDATDAWRLTSRRQRLIIGAAGMLAELALAVPATYAWLLLPEGPARGAAFILASVTWVSTLAINLSPFMRFDGYYLLADAWGIDNLQPRAFALARWQMRRWLFQTPEAKPEQLTLALERRLIAYAFATWTYRLVVFTAIALMVYHLFFKLLGLLLFAIEIGWFVILPIFRELRIWRQLYAQLPKGSRRRMTIPGAIAAIALFLLIPWQTRLAIPAVLQAKHVVFYAPEPAMIEEIYVQPGQRVAEGQALFKLRAPRLEADLRRAEKRLEVQRLRLKRAETAPDLAADLPIATRQSAVEATRLAGLQARRERLVVRAPFDGKIAELSDAAHSGRWLDPSEPLAVLVQPGNVRLLGLAEQDVGALRIGQRATFIPDIPFAHAIAASIEAVEAASVATLDPNLRYLASLHGGDVATQTNPDGQPIPRVPAYVVRFAIDTTSNVDHEVRGIAQVETPPRNLARRVYETALAVLIRESGF